MDDEQLWRISRRGLLRGAGLAAVGGALVACTSDAKEAEQDNAPSIELSNQQEGDVDLSGVEGGKRIGVIGYVLTSITPNRGVEELKRLAPELDWEFDFFDPNGDLTQLPGAVQDFTTRGVDAIYAWVAPGVLFGDALKPAADAGIPVVGVFTGAAPGLSARVEPSEWISMSRIGEYGLQRMSYSGEVAILNWDEIPPLIMRGSQIRAMLAHHEQDGVRVVADEQLKVPGQIEDAKAKTAALLQRYPNLKWIIGGWDEPAIGANQAVKEAGRDDVFVTGLDGNIETLDAIRAGDPLSATCGNDIELMSRVAIDITDKLLKKESVPPVTMVDSPFIGPENVPPPGQYAKGSLTNFYSPA